MGTGCSTHADSSDHFSTDLDGKPSAEKQNVAVDVAKGLQSGDFRDKVC
jgi:hypothetical protein